MKAKTYTVIQNGKTKYEGESQERALQTFFACKNEARTNNHIDYAVNGVVTTSHTS